MKLTCDDFTPFIDAYIDDEFDERERVEMESHLNHCLECRHRVVFQMKFKQQFRQVLSQDKVPEPLKNDILASLKEEAVMQHRVLERSTFVSRMRRVGFMVTPIAAAMCIMFLLPAFTVAPATSGALPVVEHTVDWHQRNYPLEVQSPSAKVISNWFHGKVDFPVRLPQFPGKKVFIQGCRIAHVLDRRAAYVLYNVDGTRMSVLMFQGDGLKVPGHTIRKIQQRDVAFMNAHGYNVAVMRNDGVTYAMTTALPEAKFIEIMKDSLKR